MVCIDGVYDKANPPKHDLPPLPHDVADVHDPSPDIDAEPPVINAGKTALSDTTQADAEAEVATSGFSTGSEVMDDILEHSQLRMLEAIEQLAKRVDILATNVATGNIASNGAGQGQGQGKAQGQVGLGEKLDPAMK